MTDDAIIAHQRCWDLLRQMRHHLQDEGLISLSEYGWLVADAPGVSGAGSPSPRRLESYDEIKARLATVDELEARLREVSGQVAAVRAWTETEPRSGCRAGCKRIVASLLADAARAQETT